MSPGPPVGAPLLVVIPRHSRRRPRGIRHQDPNRNVRATPPSGPRSVAALSFPDPRQERASVTDGTVIIIGGAEDKIRDRVILNRFVALAGGRDATIVVISTASSLGTEAAERYRQIFGDLGVQTVRPLHATSRPQANDETAALA